MGGELSATRQFFVVFTGNRQPSLDAARRSLKSEKCSRSDRRKLFGREIVELDEHYMRGQWTDDQAQPFGGGGFKQGRDAAPQIAVADAVNVDGIEPVLIVCHRHWLAQCLEALPQ